METFEVGIHITIDATHKYYFKSIKVFKGKVY